MSGATRRLPVHVTSFVGRDDELSAVRDGLARCRLVSLLGPGGVGKTRLAIETARALDAEMPDGAWFVSLAHLTDPAQVAQAVAGALAMKFSTTNVVDHLVAALVDLEILVVLDNCEHVLSGCQAFVARVLPMAPGARILTASRQPLGIVGERVIEVRPLETPASDAPLRTQEATRYPAIRLLDERASAISSHYRLTDETVGVVAQLVRRLDGLPLAIELAAARLRSLSLPELLDRVSDRFRILGGGDPTGLPHHRTLRAMVEWSHELCSPAEQRLWARMSVFTETAELRAVEAVCAERRSADVLDTLDGLVAKSILSTETTPCGLRYRMLESIREYGREQLRARGEEQVLQQRHRRHYLQVAERAGAAFWGPDQARQLAHLTTELPNFGAAFDSFVRDGDAHARRNALALAARLRILWVMGGHLQEGRRRLEQALAAHTAACPERVEALWSCAWVAMLQGDQDAARDRLDECAALDAVAGPNTHSYRATWQGSLALFTGDLAAAVEQFTVAAAGHRTHGSAEGLLMSLFQLALTQALLGHPAEANRLCDEALECSTSIGDGWARSYTLWARAHVAVVEGRLAHAVTAGCQSLELSMPLENQLGVVLALEVLAVALVAAGRHHEGATLLGGAETTWRKIGTDLRAFGPQLARLRDQAAARAQAALGPAGYRKAHQEGAALGRAQLRTYLGTVARTYGDDGGAAPNTPEPRSLTRRERQVAALVGKGMSNRDIAAQLVLSHRTVEGHVEHILAKLGFRSRAEIAVWATTRDPGD